MVPGGKERNDLRPVASDHVGSRAVNDGPTRVGNVRQVSGLADRRECWYILRASCDLGRAQRFAVTDFNRWIRIGILVETAWREKSPSWHWFYTRIVDVPRIGVVDHAVPWAHRVLKEYRWP